MYNYMILKNFINEKISNYPNKNNEELKSATYYKYIFIMSIYLLVVVFFLELFKSCCACVKCLLAP